MSVMIGCGSRKEATPTHLPTPYSTSTAIKTTKVTPMATKTPTESPTPSYFSQTRSEIHHLIFSNLTETGQIIFSYDLESEKGEIIFEMPPEMSLHNIGVTPVPGQSSDELIPLPQREGLGWASLYLSPDAKTLVAITAPHGQAPSYIHQINLDSKTVVSILIAEDYQWRIPLVEGRIPDILKNIRPGYEEYAVALALLDFPSIQWAPDSRGFIFTIQTLTDTPPAQMYFVSRYSEEAIPLISAESGSDIGISARWSPDGNSIAFPRFESKEGIWIIDQLENTIGRSISSINELARLSAPIWSPDGNFLAIKAGLAEQTVGDLYLINIEEDKTDLLTDLTDRYSAVGDQATLIAIQWLDDQSGLVYYEVGKHSQSSVIDRIVKHFDLDTMQEYVLSDLPAAYIGGYFVPSVTLSPNDELIVFLYGEPCTNNLPENDFASNISFEFQILSIQERKVVFIPPPGECIALPSWSPDGHLIAGHSGDDIVVWDLDSGESTIVAPELEGRKIFLGWVPDPQLGE
jgi:hypothetical protein